MARRTLVLFACLLFAPHLLAQAEVEPAPAAFTPLVSTAPNQTNPNQRDPNQTRGAASDPSQELRWQRRDWHYSPGPERSNFGSLRLGRAQDTGRLLNSGYHAMLRFEFDAAWSVELYSSLLYDFSHLDDTEEGEDVLQNIPVIGIHELAFGLRTFTARSVVVNAGLAVHTQHDEDRMQRMGGGLFATIEVFPADLPEESERDAFGEFLPYDDFPLYFELRPAVFLVEHGEVRADLLALAGVRVWDELNMFVATRVLIWRDGTLAIFVLGGSLAFGWQ